MKKYKRYVDVISLQNKYGKITPMYIVWDDGNKYEIDKIKSVAMRASQVGGCGICYSCVIGGHLRDLFYEKNRWFVESFKP